MYVYLLTYILFRVDLSFVHQKASHKGACSPATYSKIAVTLGKKNRVCLLAGKKS